jgi:low temperature requirement protein LtrA
LFFDLVYVLAWTQLSHGLIQQLNWTGAFQTLVLLLALWWVWVHTAGFTDQFDPQRPQIQLVVTVSMLDTLVLAAVAPEAFGQQGQSSRACTSPCRSGGASLSWSSGPATKRSASMLGSWSGSGYRRCPGSLGAVTQGSARATLWILAVAVDSAAKPLRWPVPRLDRAGVSEFAITGEHLAERFRQFFIIALGELILVTGLPFTAGGVKADRTGALVVSFATTVLFWRIYIYRAGELLATAIAAARDPVRIGLAQAYAHLIMVAGIVVTAVGQELIIAHPSGHTRPAWTAAILGGPALFLAGRAIFEYAVFDRVSLDRPIGLLVLAAVAPVTLHLPPLLAATAATAVLAGVAIADAGRARVHPHEPPSPAGGPA